METRIKRERGTDVLGRYMMLIMLCVMITKINFGDNFLILLTVWSKINNGGELSDTVCKYQLYPNEITKTERTFVLHLLQCT